MDTSSLIVIVTPTMTLITLLTGIALPFIAGSRSGRSRAGVAGIRPSAEADRRRTEGTATQTPPCGRRPRRIPVRSLYPHPLPRLLGRDAPLGPRGADRQADGKMDLLHQRQLGPTRGRGQPRLHQPRRIRDRHPVPRSLPEEYDRWPGVRCARPRPPPLRACPGPGPSLPRARRLRGRLPGRHPRLAVRKARVHVGALPARGRSVPSRIPGRRDPGSRRPLRVGGPALLRHPPGRRGPPVPRGRRASRTRGTARTFRQGAAPRHGRRSPRPWRHDRAVHRRAPPVPDGATARATVTCSPGRPPDGARTRHRRQDKPMSYPQPTYPAAGGETRTCRVGED